MRTLKWEVMYERFQKRYVHAPDSPTAWKLAEDMLPGAAIKCVRKCNR